LLRPMLCRWWVKAMERAVTSAHPTRSIIA
jgi:hypothetical protein